MWIGVEDVPVKKFISKLVLKRWLSLAKLHQRKHNLKNEIDLGEFETTER